MMIEAPRVSDGGEQTIKTFLKNAISKPSVLAVYNLRLPLIKIKLCSIPACGKRRAASFFILIKMSDLNGDLGSWGNKVRAVCF